MLERLQVWAKRVKRDGVTLWFAARNPQTPWYAKALGVFIVAYALSPIDLIPDFIPVLGYLDDVILLPGLIWLAIRLLPAPVLEHCRSQADQWMQTKGKKPTSRVGVLLVLAVWIAATVGFWYWVLKPWLDNPELRASQRIQGRRGFDHLMGGRDGQAIPATTAMTSTICGCPVCG